MRIARMRFEGLCFLFIIDDFSLQNHAVSLQKTQFLSLNNFSMITIGYDL